MNTPTIVRKACSSVGNLCARYERALAENARLRKAMRPIAKMAPQGDIGWKGNKTAVCGFVLVKHVLAADAALKEVVK
jgi:hypothetical protein